MISRIFAEMHRFQGEYLLPRHTMYLYHVFFELWLHILPWAAEMNIKNFLHARVTLHFVPGTKQTLMVLPRHSGVYFVPSVYM